MPGDERFAVVKRMLERCGYRFVRVSGSHYIFAKPGVGTRSSPVHHGKMRAVYVRQIEKECGKD